VTTDDRPTNLPADIPDALRRHLAGIHAVPTEVVEAMDAADFLVGRVVTVAIVELAEIAQELANIGRPTPYVLTQTIEALKAAHPLRIHWEMHQALDALRDTLGDH
jgi:hypothetical protein